MTAFAKLGNATINFFMSVCLYVCTSVRMEYPEFSSNLSFADFSKIVDEVQVSLKSYNKNNGYST